MLELLFVFAIIGLGTLAFFAGCVALVKWLVKGVKNIFKDE